MQSLVVFGIGTSSVSKSFVCSGRPLDFKSSCNKRLFKAFSYKNALKTTAHFNEQNELIEGNKAGIYLKRYLKQRLFILKHNRTWRGLRHLQRLPVRGQRAKTNAQTQKNINR